MPLLVAYCLIAGLVGMVIGIVIGLHLASSLVKGHFSHLITGMQNHHAQPVSPQQPVGQYDRPHYY